MDLFVTTEGFSNLTGALSIMMGMRSSEAMLRILTECSQDSGHTGRGRQFSSYAVTMLFSDNSGSTADSLWPRGFQSSSHVTRCFASLGTKPASWDTRRALKVRSYLEVPKELCGSVS